MQATCPGCNTLYVLDERQDLGKNATMTCLECGQVWEIGAPQRPAPADPAPRRPTEATPPAPRPESARPATRRKRPAQSAQVTCPECGHRFTPGTPRREGKRSRSAKGPRTILLVEDQKYFAELTRDALGRDYETVVADTIAAARDLLERSDFDLVILDLSLEGQDGSTMLRTTSRRGIPVLVFTARDETDLYEGEWDRLRAAGATDILIKGMNVEDELRAKVASLLGASG